MRRQLVLWVGFHREVSMRGQWRAGCEDGIATCTAPMSAGRAR